MAYGKKEFQKEYPFYLASLPKHQRDFTKKQYARKAKIRQNCLGQLSVFFGAL